MNNIEELKAAATAMRLSSTVRITNEMITFRRLFTPDCALALIAQLEAAQKELSAANEKLSKPVVLPRMHVGFDGVSTNAGDSVRNKAISDCAEAIRTAGFTADEGKDLWLM